MSDFKLSGHLEILGIQGLKPHIEDMRRQLASLKAESSLGDSSKFVASQEKAAKAVGRTKAEIFAATTNLQDFSDKAALALRRFTAFSLAAGATFGSARLIFGGLRDAANFQRELVKVQQVSGATANTISDLRDEITRLGTSLAAPASELADVSKTLSQAGFKISEVKALLETLAQTRLAATFGTIQDSTEGIIAISGQFKTKVSDMSDAFGVINTVAAKYAVESNDLISAIRRTGGVFAATSSDIDDSVTSLSKFSALYTAVRQTTRQSPETIATGLRTIFARLERPKTVNFFKDLGIDLTDASGKFIGVYDAIQKIGQSLDGLDTRSLKFAQIVEAIGGARQLGVVVPLIKEWRLEQEVLNTALGGTKSLITDVALPLDTINERVKILANTWNAFTRDVFNNQTFQTLAKEALTFAGAVVKVADSLSAFIPILTAIAAAKLGAAIAEQGAVGYFINRIGSGHLKAPGQASGGYIPGAGRGDKVPIMAEPGEFIIRKDAASALGASALNKLNHADKFAMGGMVGYKMRGYADGGFTDVPSIKESTSQFLTEGKKLGINFTHLNNIVAEVSKVLESVSDGLKRNTATTLYKGALQSVNRRPDLPGGGTNGGALFTPLADALGRPGRSLVPLSSNRRDFILPNLEPQINFTNRQSLPQQFSPLLLTDQRRKNLVPLNHPSIFNPEYDLGNNFNTNAPAYDAFADLSRKRVGVTQYGTLSQRGLSLGLSDLSDEEKQQYIQSGLVSSTPYHSDRISLSRRLNRLRSRARVGIDSAISGVGGAGVRLGKSALSANPLTLGLVAAGTQYAGDRLGVDSRITGAFSGALGGAAVGSAIGGPFGTAAGALIGGATGLAGASQQKDLDAVNKELQKSAKDLGKAFDDLSSGGVARLDAFLKTQIDLSNKKSDIENRSFGNKLGAGLADLNFSSFVPDNVTNNPETHGALEHINRAILPKIFNDVGGGIGTALSYDALSSDKNRASSQAEINTDTAQKARDRIRELVARGRSKDVTNTLLQASFSDDANKLQGLAAARSSKNDNGATLRNLIGEARNNLLNKNDVDKGLGLNFALKNIDLFASKLEKASNLLGVFGNNLEQSQSDIQNVFNQANGDTTVNKTFNNPFTNIRGLDRGQIAESINSLQGFVGNKIDPQASAILQATPILQDLPKIINDQIDQVTSRGGKIEDSGKFIENQLTGRTGPLGTLPDQIKKDLGNVFGSLQPEDLNAYLSGSKDSRVSNEIGNKINNITEKTAETFKELQAAANELDKTFTVTAANQRASLLNKADTLNAGRSDIFANFATARDTARGFQTDPGISRNLELGSVRALTGGLDDPHQIADRIRSLQAQKGLADSGINPVTGKGFNNVVDQGRASSEYSNSLNSANNGLTKLAQSSIGLAAIQSKLAEIDSRRLGLSSSVISDALGGNQESIVRGKAALELYQKRGLKSVIASGLTAADLEGGINREKGRKENIEGKASADKFYKDIATSLNKQGAGLIIDPKEAAVNAKAFDSLDKIKEGLLGGLDQVFTTQIQAIDEQRKLLAENLSKFDDTITLKFVKGISDLQKVVQQIHIPDSIKIEGTVIHQHTFTGLDFSHLSPQMKLIAEQVVNKALSTNTDGRIKPTTNIPGSSSEGLEAGFGGSR